MDKVIKEQEIFHYVRKHASDFTSIIINGLVTGLKEENNRLKNQKNKVEVGLVVLADKSKIDKIKTNMKECLIDAFENCTFIKTDSLLKKIKENA
jgi:flagellar biosynthesis regulator FlaF